MARKRQPSMRDVAARAGVSQTTVSLVLNNPATSGIPESTQARIRAAIEEVGYRTNRLARAMRLDRTDTIGFISDDIATTPYANRMIRGAQDAAWEAGRLLLIVSTGAFDHPDHQTIEQTAIDQLLERQVDGIVLAAMFHRVLDLPDGLREKPSVLLNASSEAPDIASVVPDEYSAAYEATSYLTDRGHRRIAHLTTRYPGAAWTLRLQGFRDAVEAVGATVDEDLVLFDESTTEGGRRATRLLLEHPDPPTAIFCHNDQYAMGAYQVANDLGVRIPEDLSVVGFDDQQLIAAEIVPGLTTMRLPHYEMGQWVIQKLLDPEAGPLNATLPCPLIERASVAPPAGRG
ncbi:MAG: LacI family DNA-binding transcriptional regulator [Actinomycetota bacterium]